jgi:hypothetical protein
MQGPFHLLGTPGKKWLQLLYCLAAGAGILPGFLRHFTSVTGTEAQSAFKPDSVKGGIKCSVNAGQAGSISVKHMLALCSSSTDPFVVFEWPEGMRVALEGFGAACERSGVCLYTFDYDRYHKALPRFVHDAWELIAWTLHIWGPSAVTPSMWHRLDTCHDVLAFFDEHHVTAAAMDERSVERRHLALKRVLPRSQNFGGARKKHENQGDTLTLCSEALDYADCAETEHHLHARACNLKHGETVPAAAGTARRGLGGAGDEADAADDEAGVDPTLLEHESELERQLEEVDDEERIASEDEDEDEEDEEDDADN